MLSKNSSWHLGIDHSLEAEIMHENYLGELKNLLDFFFEVIKLLKSILGTDGKLGKPFQTL